MEYNSALSAVYGILRDEAESTHFWRIREVKCVFGENTVFSKIRSSREILDLDFDNFRNPVPFAWSVIEVGQKKSQNVFV
jgi:hypothetical protein